MTKLSASEAVFGFMGWLSRREETLHGGSSHDCAGIADIVQEFCDANNFDPPVGDWIKNLVHPS